MTENNDILNKTIVIGLTYIDANGKETEKMQFWGTIIKVDNKAGIEVFNETTHSTLTLPLDLTAIEATRPGIYTLKSSGEIVANPDYIATWIITR